MVREAITSAREAVFGFRFFLGGSELLSASASSASLSESLASSGCWYVSSSSPEPDSVPLDWDFASRTTEYQLASLIMRVCITRVDNGRNICLRRLVGRVICSSSICDVVSVLLILESGEAL